ncbi:AAA family ATPase [bacterium]|nr:AAA family ATPase [bacterium]
MTTRICLINQKGGCGKSSLCFHLSGALARMGLSVLLIDCDPQGSLSQGFLGPAFVESLDASDTLAGLFDDQDRVTAPLLQPILTPIPMVSLIPASLHLARYNTPRPETSGLLQFALREFLESIADFDIVLLDCPPNLYQCTWNALLASDHVLIPVPPEDFGTQGLGAVHQAVSSARLLHPHLNLLGHVVTRCDRRLLIHQAYEQKLRQLYGESVLNCVVPEASAFKVALASRQPVAVFCARSKAAHSMNLLASEILQRVHRTTHQQRTVA